MHYFDYLVANIIKLLNCYLTHRLVILSYAEVQFVSVRKVKHAGAAVTSAVNIPRVFGREIIVLIKHVGNVATQIATVGDASGGH